jgi:hypothetical protein
MVDAKISSASESVAAWNTGPGFFHASLDYQGFQWYSFTDILDGSAYKNNTERCGPIQVVTIK